MKLRINSNFASLFTFQSTIRSIRQIRVQIASTFSRYRAWTMKMLKVLKVLKVEYVTFIYTYIYNTSHLAKVIESTFNTFNTFNTRLCEWLRTDADCPCCGRWQQRLRWRHVIMAGMALNYYWCQEQNLLASRAKSIGVSMKTPIVFGANTNRNWGSRQ